MVTCRSVFLVSYLLISLFLPSFVSADTVKSQISNNQRQTTKRRPVVKKKHKKTPSIPVQVAPVGTGGSVGPTANTVSAVIQPSRIVGVAPLAITFDGTASSATTESNSFHKLFYLWNFGDLQAGSWSINGRSKNIAIGPIAAHVYDKPGTYTTMLLVREPNGGIDIAQSATIQVLDPDVVYAGSKTSCVSKLGDFTACPAGADQITTSTLTVIHNKLRGGNRVLLHAGENWDLDTDSGGSLNLTGIGGTLSSYGAGRAKLTLYGNGNAIQFNQAIDWRVVNIDIDSKTPVSPNIQSVGIASYAPCTQTLVEYVKMTGNYYAAYGEAWSASDTEIYLVDSVLVPEFDIYTINISGSKIAVLGVIAEPTATNLHVMRAYQIEKGVISSNRLVEPNVDSTRHALKLHAEAGFGKDTTEVVVSDNYVSGGVYTVQISPQNNTCSDGRGMEKIRDVIFERNLVVSGPPTSQGVHLLGKGLTVRNNIIKADSKDKYFDAIVVATNNCPNLSDNVSIDHNTILSSAANVSGNEFFSYSIDPAAGAVSCSNNLTWARNISFWSKSPSRSVSSQTTLSTNINYVGGSLDPDPMLVDPNFNPSLKTGSPAIAAGVPSGVVEDFLLRLRIGPGKSAPDIGALAY